MAGESLIETGLEKQPVDRGMLNKALSRNARCQDTESSAAQNTGALVPQEAAFTIQGEGSCVTEHSLSWGQGIMLISFRPLTPTESFGMTVTL